VSAKQVIPRTLACRDIEEAVEHHLGEGGAEVALGFVEALEQAFAHIGRYPASGSPRYGHELGIPGLRSWPLGRFPHLVFYVERRSHVDVWRVLHGVRDIPAWMREGGAL